jgi:simple sugar transport system ATP-binding protein
MLWAGKRVGFQSARDAYELGIATVFQDLALVDLMSIYRNMIIGREHQVSRGHWPLRWIDRKRARHLAQDAIANLGINLRSPDESVASLSGGQRQSIAIARAVHFSAKVLILDEPTSALSLKQVGQVLSTIERAKERGIGVLLISHNVHHVESVADRFVVLSHGESIAAFRRGECTTGQIEDMIITGKAAAESILGPRSPARGATASPRT